ncbi:hypothetical protein LTR37_011123 [Vermiconidia calcicola]|uniref:Uncharacterized protein n=1 Tax=Vermiconidia calcicola TaxID=1690605 RepID=A0ACC3N3F5_9PEZI|nr:hypothetical protein LTR37_011123 [Vermiconidia calcicola]
MAESKRNNAAGKVATPKATGAPATPSAPPVMDTLDALGKSIGARIRLTTAAPHSQTYEGTLFTACPTLNIVAINTRASPEASAQPGDYHIVPLPRVQSFQVVSLARTATAGIGNCADAQPAIGFVDIKRLQDREQAKINRLKDEERNKGKGVTKEAQAIFDSFKRMYALHAPSRTLAETLTVISNMPIRWHNQEMIVHEAVIITPPYRVEDCKGAKEKQEVLNRVRKVLEGERRKLKEKEDRDRKAATPVGTRKGG